MARYIYCDNCGIKLKEGSIIVQDFIHDCIYCSYRCLVIDQRLGTMKKLTQTLVENTNKGTWDE